MAIDSNPGREPHTRFEDTFARRISALRGRILLGSVVAVLLLTGLALTLAWSQYQDGKDEALRDLRGRAILAGTVLDTFFAGQISTLESIAASPVVTAGDVPGMKAYFRRVQPPNGQRFTAGLGWLDRKGMPRATSSGAAPALSFSDRLYFRRVIATDRPFISEALVSRTSTRRVVVTAVPTHDARGRISGVLTGGFLLSPSRTDQRTVDLGFEGLQIVDRTGQQLTLRSLARPRNTELLRRMRGVKEGVLSDTGGLDGENDHVVAFATSAAPGWKIVLDQPSSAVFAGARRTLTLESALILAAAGVVLALIGWALLRSRTALRRSRTQIRRWGNLTRALGSAVDAGAVCRVLATSLAAEFPAAVVAVALGPVPDGLELVALERGRSSARLLREDEALGLARTAYDDHPVDGVRQASVHAALLASESGDPVGALAIVGRENEPLTESDAILVELYADQVAQALARVRSHERDHDTAILLQRSLLPTSLPATDGVDFAAQYQAGTSFAEVGGDWYDAVRRPDGILHLSVGDVAGRGISAAVLMGQLRNAFRAYALDHTSPAAIVERLALHLDETQMATTVCVTFDPYTRELRYTSAGHPPPLLLDDDAGTIVRLDRPGIPPIGWSPRRTPADEPVVAPARGTLVLYTDGLVERRGESLDAGVERLAASIRRHPGDALNELTGHAITETGADHTHDDAALLLARIGEVPARLRIDIPAEAGVLRELRRRLRAWMTMREVGVTQAADTILAVSEACNNAIEHGYREQAGTISIAIDHAGDSLRVSVADAGSWRDPGDDDETRGRGLLIVNGLMHDTHVVHDEEGTRISFERRL